MSFDKTFCPSPWFHMRINNDGTYNYCRWSDYAADGSKSSIRSHNPSEYFQQQMSGIRHHMLEGKPPASCGPCHRMEMHSKVSGRQKQLLKIGVQSQSFIKGLKSSPWIQEFQSVEPLDLMPQDWQIDLGNFCNSACVFCHPTSSSRIASEFKKLGMIDQLPPPNWCDDPALLDKFMQDLIKSPVLRYLHFIGGETLITPAFKTILKRLIDLKINRLVTIGFTTNLTVWDQEVIDLLQHFHKVNLGVSIECISPVNDYTRWPSKIDQVRSILARWIDLAQDRSWYLQIRVTPTILTIGQIQTVYDFALEHGVSVESCNFLERPEYLKPSVLPLESRRPIIDDLKHWIQTKSDFLNQEQVINTRHPDLVCSQIVQDAISYLNYLEDQPDDSYRLPDLVRYLKKLDQNRNISVLDYLPEYEKLFRSAGY